MDEKPGIFPRIALGLGAGLVGASLMLLSQKLEMRLSGREPSDTPAEAVERMSGIDVVGEAKATLSTAAHFAFGSALGVGLALLDRVPEPARGSLFAAGAWSAGTATLVALDIAEPPTEWDAAQLATDLGHHMVYACSAALAYAAGRRLIAAH